MNFVLWLLLCLLISIGAVQCIGWILAARRRPKHLHKGYHLIPLYENPETVEAQLRYSLSQIRWAGGGGEIVLLVDMGLGSESLALCKQMMQQSPGLFYCRGDEIHTTIRNLDDLQQMDGSIDSNVRE